MIRRGDAEGAVHYISGGAQSTPKGTAASATQFGQLIAMSDSEAQMQMDLGSAVSHPHGGALVSLSAPNLSMVPLAEQRTSRLPSPNYHLTGHADKIFSLAFDPSGNTLASGSMDASIFLWDVYAGFNNFNVLKGHKSAVLEVKWTDKSTLASASADKTVKLWDAHKGEKVIII